MSDPERVLLSDLPPSLLLILAIVVFLAYTLPRIAEASEAAAKLLGPIGRYWRERGLTRAEQHRAEVQREARQLAKAIVAEVTPPDYAEMERRLANMDRRIKVLEESDQIQRAYIIYDENWHFADEMAAVRNPECTPAPRYTFDQFKERWRQGWRPGRPSPQH